MEVLVAETLITVGSRVQGHANVSSRLLACSLVFIWWSRFVFYVSDQCPHIAATTTSVSIVCSKCGIIKKSGKSSCCAHGGSWFGNCRSFRDTKFGHTWYEGLQACTAQSQSKTVLSQQIKVDQQRMNVIPNNTDNKQPGTVATAAKLSRMSTINNFGGVLMTASAHRQVTSQGSERLLDISVHLILSLNLALFSV